MALTNIGHAMQRTGVNERELNLIGYNEPGTKLRANLICPLGVKVT